ncbi:hypothetical protein D9M71_811040 [compost metagenome]
MAAVYCTNGILPFVQLQSPDARQPRAAMVLSDLLARADERAGELAKAYDLARIAGQQCEREYDALTHHARDIR